MARSDRRSVFLALALALALAACSNETIVPLVFPDGGRPDGELPAPNVAPPQPAASPELGDLEAWAASPPNVALPELTPCPPGWLEIDETPKRCEPWPNGRQTCVGVEAQFPGEPGCRAIGGTCPSGAFADPPPSGPVLYVLPGATGGDGSPAAPFGTISAAIAAAASGTTLLLGKGRFVEHVTIDRDLTLLGACAAETMIAGIESPATTIEVEARLVTVRNLTIEGPGRGLRFIQGPPGSVLTIEGVLITATNSFAFAATGANTSVEARELIIRDNLLRGLVTADRARFNLTKIAIQRNSHIGMLVQDSHVTLSDSVITDTRDFRDDAWGLQVNTASDLRIERSVFERNPGLSLVALNPNTRLTFVDSVVRDTPAAPSRSNLGYGLGVGDGAHADIHRVFFERNVGVAFEVGSATATITDVIVRDTRARVPLENNVHHGALSAVDAEVHMARIFLGGNQDAGWLPIDTIVHARDLTSARNGFTGVIAMRGSISLKSALIEGNGGGALALLREGTQFELEDAWFRDNDSVEGGAGVYVGEGSHLVGRRVLIERHHHWGLTAQDETSTVDLEDLVIRETRPQPNQVESSCALVVAKASVNVRRTIMEKSGTHGVKIGQAAIVRLEDAIIRDTEGDPRTRMLGLGVTSVAAGDLSLVRAVVERSRTTGVYVTGEASKLYGEDLTVRDTIAAPAVIGPYSFGLGMIIAIDATAELRRVVLARNEMYGASFFQSANVDGEDLSISETIGQALDGNNGGGLVMYGGAKANLRRVSFTGNRQIGAVVADPESVLQLSDVIVRDTAPAACATRGGACEHAGIGSGLAAVRGGAMTVERFLIADNALAGLHVASSSTGVELDGSIDARDGEISGNVIGADVEIEGYDLRRISQRVLYRNNVRDLQSLTLPLPVPTLGFSE